MGKDGSKLKRDIHPIPDFVLEALKKKKLWDAYESRPAYQQKRLRRLDHARKIARQ
jgi:hypothetical protein